MRRRGAGCVRAPRLRGRPWTQATCEQRDHDRVNRPGGDPAPSPVKGPERARQIAAGDLKAFPKGIELVHDNVMAEGNLVAFHWKFVGTRESGEKLTLFGIDMVRIANGKIAEMWIEYHRFPPPQRQSQQ